MKRILFVLISLLSIVSAYASVQIGRLNYDLDESTLTAVVASKNCVSGDITIPSSITYYGTHYSVTSIGIEAFYQCTCLTSITIPESVTSIGSFAFTGCTGLTSITIPESVTSISNYAFARCTGLTSITIRDGVTSIGGSAFSNCTGLTSITIPESVTNIESDAFYGCTGLTSITIPDGVTSIESAVFYRCTGLTSITIPDGVTSIGSDAFHGCTGLTSITIPDGVTSIERSTFESCTSLTSIIIPNSVTSIGVWAFVSCSSLSSITIPNSVTSIEHGAFAGCTSLSSIQVEAQKPPQCDYYSFYKVLKDIPVHIPCGTKEAYQESVCWASFTNIIEEHDYTIAVQSFNEDCGTDTIVSYTCDNELTIQATANEHYHFTHWSDGNTENPRTFVVYKDTTLTAFFAIDSYTISTSAENGYVEGAGVYDYGTQITLTAIPNSGYEFKQWSNGMTDNPYRFIVVSDLMLDAEFVSVTAIEHTSIDTNAIPQKVLIDGQVYILRNGKTYTLTGVEVK